MRFWRHALVLVALTTALPRAVAAEDDDAHVSEERCALGNGHKAGKIVTTTDDQQCGSESCTQTQTTALEDGAGKALLVWSDDIGEAEGPPSSLALACKRGAVIISDSGGDLLTLAYEPAAHKLRLPPSVRQHVEDGWRAPPARGDTAVNRDRLADALAALTSNPGASDEPPFEVLGADLELSQSQSLLVARDQLEAGAWETAEQRIEVAVPDKPPPSELIAQRRAALLARLAALRRRSAPVVVADRHRIGAVLAPPVLPSDADAVPTLFWRGESLCVGQEDHKPPTAMRCLDPKTRRWAAREPMQKPPSSGEYLRSMSYPHVTRCDGTFVVQASVPEGDQDPCSGGPGEDEQGLVGVVDRDAMLFAGDQGLSVNRSPTKSEGLTTKQANALLATSAGSLIIGDGCCRFLSDGRVARLARDSRERRWPILGPPPPEEHWLQRSLASPLQGWAVAASQGNKSPAVTLWLLRLTTRR